MRLDADQDVLEGVVQGVAHVQDAGDVGGRDDDAIGRLAAVGPGPKEALLLPIFIPLRLDPLGIVDFVENLGHVGSCGK